MSKRGRPTSKAKVTCRSLAPNREELLCTACRSGSGKCSSSRAKRVLKAESKQAAEQGRGMIQKAVGSGDNGASSPLPQQRTKRVRVENNPAIHANVCGASARAAAGFPRERDPTGSRKQGFRGMGHFRSSMHDILNPAHARAPLGVLQPTAASTVASFGNPVSRSISGSGVGGGSSGNPGLFCSLGT